MKTHKTQQEAEADVINVNLIIDDDVDIKITTICEKSINDWNTTGEKIFYFGVSLMIISILSKFVTL